MTETTDSNGSEVDELEELRGRLTRGGLSPEAVDKAAEAYLAGDIHALNLAYVGKGAARRLICPIPDELLTRVFPELDACTDPSFSKKDLEGVFLEYEINRHRGDVRSLTIRYPDSLRNSENQEPEESASQSPDSFLKLEDEEAPAKPAEAPKRAELTPRANEDPLEDPWPIDDPEDDV